MAETGGGAITTADADSGILSQTTPALLRFEAVTKRFGQFTALDSISLDIRHGEFFALLGPSGCGKSTLLRLAAGFEEPEEGRVLLDGIDLADRAPHRRPVNMMFQSYALFPHMTVERNIAFGLKQDGVPRGEIAERVVEMLDLVQLQGLSSRKPHQLSGGQRQRVALARALVKRPRVLLLDEPLAALDKKLRQETQAQLHAVQRRLGTTFVIVTHDQEEAMTLADRIAVMERGRIAQVGTPAEIYEQPVSRYVASFIGDVNLIDGLLARSDHAGAQVDCGPAGVLRTGPASGFASGTQVTLALRPEKIQVMAERPVEVSVNALQAVVEEIAFLGESSTYKLRTTGGASLQASVPNLTRRAECPFAPGARVWLVFTPDAAMVLER